MSAPYPWLVADVGGTNARFGTVSGPGAAVEDVRVLPVAGHAGPAAAVRAYLDGQAPGSPRPQSAAFALATPVQNDRIALTNGAWDFSRAATQAELGLKTFLCLNDFEAQALSLPKLQPHQLRAWGDGPATAVGDAPVGTILAVIGPGTGLGVGGVIRAPGLWLTLPGEGGHATLAPGDDFESAVLAAARREFPHVSAERFLSGIGLPVLCRSVAAALAGSGKGEDVAALPADQIVARGLSGESPACVRTLELFCGLLGSFAGNVALTLGSRGGVFIGGGIVPRLGDYFFKSQFRARFEAKGRLRSFVDGIPTLLITDTLAALSGASLALEQADA